MQGVSGNRIASVPVSGITRRHNCMYCLKSFSLGTDLKRHILTHTGEKPFKCPHCSHRANRKGNVVVHMMSIHGDNFNQPEYNPAFLLNNIKGDC